MRPEFNYVDQSSLLEARGISKAFSGIKVLDGINLDVRRGEVHALVGENGAGKSTLVNILSGVLQPDTGELRWQSQKVRLDGPRYAQSLGISFVHQELALVPQLSVAENIFLGRHPAVRGLVNFGEMHARARRTLGDLGRDIDTRRAVAELSLAERQLVEIARSLAFDSLLIMMDEPTAPLADHDSEALLRSIRSLRARGVAVVYISHRLKEIFEISDRVTVLRDGEQVLTQPTSDVTQEELVRAMIGRELGECLASRVAGKPKAEEALRIEGAISLTVCRGEIVGLAGLAGAGRTER